MIGERKKVSEAFSVANQDYFEELIKKTTKNGLQQKRIENKSDKQNRAANFRF